MARHLRYTHTHKHFGINKSVDRLAKRIQFVVRFQGNNNLTNNKKKLVATQLIANVQFRHQFRANLQWTSESANRREGNMNPQNRNCNGCQQNGHILRFCPEHRCTQCKVLGHAERDCPLQFQLREFCLWLPYDMGARIGISRSPLREVPGVGRNLQLIRSAGTTNMNGSSFEAYYNSLRIDYGGEGSIVIAMQDAPSDAETLVQIRNVRQEGVLQTCVRIGAKYTIMGGRLVEDINRLATGSRRQQSPQGDTHVLIYLRNMLAMTAVLEVNGVKYYMEWERRRVNQNVSVEVYVFTERTYRFRINNRERELIDNARVYFRGEEAVYENNIAVREHNQPAVVEEIRGEIPVEDIAVPAVAEIEDEQILVDIVAEAEMGENEEAANPVENNVNAQPEIANEDESPNQQPATGEEQCANETMLTGEQTDGPDPTAAASNNQREMATQSASDDEGDQLHIAE